MLIFVLSVALSIIAFGIYYLGLILDRKPPPPVSVNFHLTRKCNYTCGFCFHTAKTSYIIPLDDAKRGLLLLRRAGLRKLNFAGGEPMLYPNFVGELAKYCKQDLGLESVSIVTNGSVIKADFFKRYGRWVDIVAVSCDSFDEETNIKIGRGKGAHLEKVETLARMCRDAAIKFKINTVVNRYNIREDMNDAIERLAPFRWKCFQVLLVEGENESNERLRDATKFTISNDEFAEFCKNHQGRKCIVPETSKVIQNSYLILDEYMRFLDKGNYPCWIGGCHQLSSNNHWL